MWVFTELPFSQKMTTRVLSRGMHVYWSTSITFFSGNPCSPDITIYYHKQVWFFPTGVGGLQHWVGDDLFIHCDEYQNCFKLYLNDDWG